MRLKFARALDEKATADDRFGEAAFIRIINQASSEPSSADLWRQAVAQIIVATTSDAVRDAAALALVDLDGRDFADALVEVIRRPELAQHNGTLVYALYELGEPIPFELVVQIIEQGSYEATAESLMFLKDDRLTLAPDLKEQTKLRTRLHSLVSRDEPVVRQAAAEALSYLETLEKQGSRTP